MLPEVSERTEHRARIDLHLHTTCSDGTLSPDELFDAVRAADLTAFSVTDHDTMAAYPVPQDLRERCIAGIEVDSELDGRTVHLLAYGVAANAPLLRALDAQRSDRLRRMDRTVENLRELGYGIELDDVLAQAGTAASLGRPHLARALVARGIVASVQEAFDRFLADGGPAFVPLRRLTAQRIIELVHASGGVAIVAHPKRLRALGDLTALVDAGIDGIEVAHPSAGPDDAVALAAFAAERNLLTTGGSDFHAPGADGVCLGVPFDRTAVERLRSVLASTSAATGLR